MVLTFTEIAESLGIDKSSAHRFIHTLIAAGLVERGPVRRGYHLAGKALWVGSGYLRYSPIYRAGYGELEKLAHSTNTMAHLGIWDNDTVLYLQTAGPPRTSLLFTDVGQRRPVHCTGMGKAMLAYRPASDLERVLARDCGCYTNKTITSVDAMRKDLVRIRRLGYAVDNEESIQGLRCVAAAIRNNRAEVVAALSVSGPLAQLTDPEIPRYARLVQQAALRASAQLGYQGLVPQLLLSLGE